MKLSTTSGTKSKQFRLPIPERFSLSSTSYDTLTLIVSNTTTISAKQFDTALKATVDINWIVIICMYNTTLELQQTSGEYPKTSCSHIDVCAHDVPGYQVIAHKLQYTTNFQLKDPFNAQ